MITNTTLTETMLATMRRYSMLARGDKVLVAVSGGPDSVALLHALWSLRDDLGISLSVAHLNHSFRGADSDADAQYVRELAGSLGLAAAIETVDVPEIQRTLHMSAEEAARMVRYDFLERTASGVGANNIALGHTADDQVETVLLNLIRGAGLDGLSGMPPVRGKFVRPLINIRRSQVEEYNDAHGLHPRTDVTNLQPIYTRNRVRLELLPTLRAEYNPKIDAAILRLAELVRDDSAYLSKETDQIVEKITIVREQGAVSIDAHALLDCPLAIRRRAIRSSVETVRGNLINIGFIHIDELLRLLDSGTDFKYELPGGTYVERIGKTLDLRSERPTEIFEQYSYELSVPGKIAVPAAGVSVEAGISTVSVDYMRPPGSMEIVLDYSSIVGKLRVRRWQPGDRIRPLGMSGSKKVQDIFVDRKIPRRMRHRVPVIADDEKVIWIAGIAVSDIVKVTANTETFLILRIMSV